MNKQNQNLLLGFLCAIGICRIYKMKIDEPVFISNLRIHHYEIGLGCMYFGLTSESSFWVGFGLGLLIDDVQDLFKASDKLVKTIQTYFQ